MTNMQNIDVTSKLSNNISQLLLDLAGDFERRTLEKCHQRGHTKIRRSHTSLFSYLGYGSQRLTTLAERAGITQQAMGKLVKELEREGYLKRHVDTIDKRAKIIEPTDIGKNLVDDCLEIVDEIIQEYTILLGEESFQDLERALRNATKSLNTKHKSQVL